MRKILAIAVLMLGLGPLALVHADSRCLEFHASAISNEIEKVKQFLDQGVDVNCRDSWNNETALIKIVASGRVEIVKLLLERGADINVRGDNGWTALSYALVIQKSLKDASASFANLRQRVDEVIRILREKRGKE